MSESVEVWSKLARRATNLLAVASAVRAPREVTLKMWEAADGYGFSFGERYGPKHAFLDEPWQRLAADLEWWILAADVCLQVRAEGRSLVASLAGNSFTFSSFALVAMQLVLAVLRAEGLLTCDGCNAPFVSSRPPLAGKQVGPQLAKRNYCQNCRKAKIAQRDAARDYRQRQKNGLMH